MSTSVTRLQQKIVDLNSLTAWADLTGDRLAMYKLLKVAELEATIKIHEFLDSIIDPPLDEDERKLVYDARRDDFLSNNTGDGMDQERVDAEVEAISDWEFVTNFGRAKDLAEEEENEQE